MKYLYTFVSVFVAFSLLASLRPVTAQQTRESTAELEGIARPVFEINFDYPPDIVQEALLEKLQKDRVAVRKKKNLISGQNVQYNVLSSAPLDLYFRTEGKEKKGKGTATLELFISKGRDNFIGKAFDPELSEKAIGYLDNLRPVIDEYALRWTVNEKEKALEKVRDDYEDLLKDKRKRQEKLYDAKKDQSKATEDKALKKASKRIRKSDKKIRKMERDLRSLETDMEQRKSEIRVMRRQLLEMQRKSQS